MARLTSILILGLILLAPLPSRGETRAPGDEPMIQRRQWEGPLPAGAEVDATNPHGDIRARRVDGSDVILLGVIQKLKSDPDEPVIDVNSGKAMTITVTWPEREKTGEAAPSRTPTVRRVDLTVLLPTGAHLRAKTDHGFIQAKGIRGDVTARSTTGNIVITTHGCANAYTERGAITLHLKKPGWSAPPTLETVTGDIQVRLPRDVGAEVIVETSGHITTEYSIEIDRESTSHRKRARAIISGGGQSLLIKSAKGDVKLLAPFPELKKPRAGP